MMINAALIIESIYCTNT